METSNISYNMEAVSALPPEHQEAREKEAILNDPRFMKIVERIGSDRIVIWEVKKMQGSYWIHTNLFAQKVDVRYLPPEEGICGPARFELDFHDPIWHRSDFLDRMV